jgi:tetratricopeptide (TPR) repeat protein
MDEGERNRVFLKIAKRLSEILRENPRPSLETAPAAGPKSALSNLPDRNPFFTGRDHVLAQLREALAAWGRAALSGLGGIGKSQTAVEYAYRHAGEYDYIFFATAASREALVSSYVTIASLVKLPESTAHDQTLAADAVKRWFSSNQRWLLILDNADDLAIVRELIPSGKSGHMLLTTRSGALGPIARRVEIVEMGTDEGALFLLRRAKHIPEDASLDAAVEADQTTAKEITTHLDGLPLALDQAAAYIEETGCGLSDYLELYRKHAPELLRRRGVLASDHLSVATTWALSFENIEKANPAAAELLKFCSFLHPDAIPEEMFRAGAQELGPVLGAAASDELALNGAISEILKYSLLRRNSDVRTIEIHRLVQAVLKQSMDEATQRLWAERAVRAVGRVFPIPEFSNWPVCERLLPQAYTCAELINQWGFEFREAAVLLFQAGSYLYGRGRDADVGSLYQQALTIFEKTLGPKHRNVATTLNNLAEFYYSQGRYAEAEPLYQRSLELREKALGPDHPNLASSLNQLGKLYRAQEQYEKAEALYQRSLAIQKKVLDPEHLDLAHTFNNLATCYRYQGQYAEAEPLYQRALAIWEKRPSPEHANVAAILSKLAKVYQAQGEYAKAEPLYRRSLELREKALGPDHPYVANCLENYAVLLRKMNHPEEAEPVEIRARAIRAKHA